MMTIIQRTPTLLEGPLDWEDWIKVIRTNAQARGILPLVNINAPTAPELLKEPPEPLFHRH
ncbi:hypothetical protein GJ744_008634 [Endocarpon pusillum]|uniref:Uncharacterized protein n=1 Tax=Endocarpon pusillum TaxID=364733 RepID=A0A8H7APQ3_9EURO|nr:hypothetical protein GJ744_008634 [Endocarpon pusillum]